jgi:hypothetical protein
MIDDVRRREFVARKGEHPSDVEGHVADDDDALVVEVDTVVSEVRVPVVPPHEFRGRVTAAEGLARDPELSVDCGARRVHDRVIAVDEFLLRDVGAHLDVAPRAKPLGTARLP